MTVTRFAPSPTGRLHLGNLRAAVLAFLLARRDGGTFLLRLDDTDPDRSTEAFAEAIRDDLAWLGLAWDAELRQSERRDRHLAAVEALKASGRAYPCWETAEELALRRRAALSAGRPPVYDRAALKLDDAERARLAAERPPHWRLRLSDGRVDWTDGIRGPVSIDLAAVSDPVLLTEDGRVLYTLASAVDDIETGVTDIVRGEDHVTNTAAQIDLMRALGAAPPRFAHHPLMVGPDGGPLSKREGAASLDALREAGVEPAAVTALLARLGTGEAPAPVAAAEDLAPGFDLARFGTAPTRLDPADLGPLSRRALREMPWSAAAPRLMALGLVGPEAEALWPVVRGNLDRFEDVADWHALTVEGAAPVATPEDADFVRQALARLPPRPWTEATWGEWTADMRAATGRKGGALFRPLRRALTGRGSGPEMAALMPLLQGPPPRAEDVVVAPPAAGPALDGAGRRGEA